jgi:hypothetical protein
MLALIDDRQALVHALGQAQDTVKDLRAKMSNSKFNAEQRSKKIDHLFAVIRSAPCPNGDDGCKYMSNPVCCSKYGTDDHDCWKLEALELPDEESDES